MILIGAFGTMIISVVLPTLGTYNRGPYALHNGGKFLLVKEAIGAGQGTVNPLVDGSPTPAKHRYSVKRVPSSANLAGDTSQSIVLIGGKPVAELTLLDYLKVGSPLLVACGTWRPHPLPNRSQQHPLGFQAFTAHLTSEFSVENIKFWHDVEYFRAHFHDGEAGRLQALLLYVQRIGLGVLWRHASFTGQRFLCALRFELYVDEKGPLWVNVSSAQREAVAKRVLAAETTSSDMFDECQEEIYKLMERDSYVRYDVLPTFWVLSLNDWPCAASHGSSEVHCTSVYCSAYAESELREWRSEPACATWLANPTLAVKAVAAANAAPDARGAACQRKRHRPWRNGMPAKTLCALLTAGASAAA